MNKLVSVITPSFNSDKTIRYTLESMVNQVYKNYEYIIIDGGSNDNTLKIIDEYKHLFGERLKIISEKDNGIYDAMNKGISIAKGELIGILNSDDWYEKNTIELAVKNYKGNKYEVIYGIQRNIKNEKRYIEFIKSHEFLNEHMITHPTCFVSKKIYDDFGGFDTNYISSADYDFMLRLYYSNSVNFNPVYKVMSNFRVGGMSSNQIGVRETAKIKYKYGIISKNKCRLIILKSKIYSFITKRK
ncbi:glycosyltransferase family 2 protein [Clostridium perfringens]|uniref:glycosyltransferase family 2 protein n=1 Tax=Clostridium perfringens TaxID=1502 RepID=UPI003AF46620